jgi:hypothetical protein
MARTLTIVARRPSFQGPLDDESAIDEQDEAIDAVMIMLRARTDHASHVVMRASTVEQVRKCISLYNQVPHQLQLIGHGRPGALLFGSAWPSTGAAPPAGTPTLDSDPSAYGVLLQQISSPTAEVLLLGCSVGDPAHKPTNVVDGAAFVFDLTRMLDINIAAPVTTIDDTDFDPEGVFSSRAKLCTAHGLSVALPPGFPLPISSGGPPQQMRFLECIAAPALEHVPHHAVAVLDGHPALQTLSFLFYARFQPRALLAAPELSFAVMSNGKQRVGDIICNGRFLRLRKTQQDATSYFILPIDARRDIAKLVTKLIRFTP